MENEEWDIEKLKNEIDVGNSLTSEQKDELYQTLLKYKVTLSKNENDIGTADVTPQRIILTDKTPIWQKPRRFSEPLNKEIDDQCKQLEMNEIIENGTLM